MTHMVSRMFGGDPGVRNLVPLETLANISYIKVAENKTEKLRKQGISGLYVMVEASYRDDPRLVGTGYEEFNRIPEILHYRLINLGTRKNLIDEKVPTGGPLLAFAGARRPLERARPELAGE